MTRRLSFDVVFLATALALSGVVPAAAQQLVSGEQAAELIVLRNVETTGRGAMTGVLVNLSEQQVSNVRLLVRHSFLWNRERAPKDPADNPGRAAFYEIAGAIPAEAAIPFAYEPNPPLPSRTDGRFKTSVELVSFVATTP